MKFINWTLAFWKTLLRMNRLLGKKPANDVSDKGLLSRTYVKFSGLNNKKTNNPIKKKKGTGLDTSPEIYKWQTNTWKDVRHFSISIWDTHIQTRTTLAHIYCRGYRHGTITPSADKAMEALECPEPAHRNVRWENSPAVSYKGNIHPPWDLHPPAPSPIPLLLFTHEK